MGSLPVQTAVILFSRSMTLIFCSGEVSGGHNHVTQLSWPCWSLGNLTNNELNGEQWVWVKIRPRDNGWGQKASSDILASLQCWGRPGTKLRSWACWSGWTSKRQEAKHPHSCHTTDPCSCCIASSYRQLLRERKFTPLFLPCATMIRVGKELTLHPVRSSPWLCQQYS